ncbi:MAG: tetratricopeptide repeat protein [Planctomycetaceae bacterium]|nr:tetratricopeptide repeat protein [Planctomycetaceae bacterium]
MMAALLLADDSVPVDFPYDAWEPEFSLWDFIIYGWTPWPLLNFAALAFVIWMGIFCYRNDPERYLWLWLIVFFRPLGAIIYFFVRWLPGTNVQAPSFMQKVTRKREINRLQIAAQQIGNPHQFIELGDALRETGRWDKSLDAYLKALNKDPKNPQALWGAACGQYHKSQYEGANENLTKLLEIDPAYKFGDVSLLQGKTLHALGRADEACTHLEGHIKRWRHPEAIYLLANLYADSGQSATAREQLQSLIMDIDASPSAIARKQGTWKRKAKSMLRKLPNAS